MVPSNTSGEFTLIRLVSTQFWSTNSSPNTILAISTESCARRQCVTEPISGLSLYLKWL